MLPPTPRLASACGRSRSVANEQVLRSLRVAAGRFGVTRVGATTALDTLGIHTATAVRADVVPPSITVASGKGPTPLDAELSALAEAYERYCAEPRGRIPTSRKPFDAAQEVAPRSLHLASWSRYADGATLSWCEGIELRSGSARAVPAGAVFFPYDAPAEEHLFSAGTTGLAAGGSLVDAASRGLLECIERDQYSLALASLARGEPAGGALRAGDLGEEVVQLAASIERAGVTLLLRDVTGDLGVPTVCAVVDDGDGAHLGCAAHPDARVAAAEALMEAAQSRVTDLQGAREDLTARDPTERPHPWFVDVHARPGAPPSSRHFDDVAEELRWLVERVERVTGFTPLLVPLGLLPEVAAVRVIAPGLEVWAADPDRAGARVRRRLGFDP